MTKNVLYMFNDGTAILLKDLVNENQAFVDALNAQNLNFVNIGNSGFHKNTLVRWKVVNEDGSDIEVTESPVKFSFQDGGTQVVSLPDFNASAFTSELNTPSKTFIGTADSGFNKSQLRKFEAI